MGIRKELLQDQLDTILDNILAHNITNNIMILGIWKELLQDKLDTILDNIIAHNITTQLDKEAHNITILIVQ